MLSDVNIRQLRMLETRTTILRTTISLVNELWTMKIEHNICVTNCISSHNTITLHSRLTEWCPATICVVCVSANCSDCICARGVCALCTCINVSVRNIVGWCYIMTPINYTGISLFIYILCLFTGCKGDYAIAHVAWKILCNWSSIGTYVMCIYSTVAAVLVFRW